MKKLAVLTGAVLTLVALPLNAQSVYVGVGGAFPTGDDMEGVNAGFQLVGGVTVDVASQLSIYGEGSWGTHGTEFDGVDLGVDAKPYALMAGLLLDLMSDEDAPATPYVFGGAGLQWIKLTDGDTDISDNAFGFQLGAGVGFNLGPVDGFAEGRYARAGFDADSDLSDGEEFTFAAFGLVAGVSINLGGN